MNNIIDIFKNKVTDIGEKTALYFRDIRLSYTQLDILSDKLAEYLITMGIKENDIVPVYCQSGIERIISIFAILKSGAAYLPIPIDTTEERFQYLVQDSGSDIIVCDQVFKNITGIRYVNLKDIDINKINLTGKKLKCGNIAYVIYTSGSTGTPKGVKISHNNLMYILNNMQKHYPLRSTDKYLLNTAYSFDVSVAEIFGWILGGGSLVVSELEHKKNFIKLFDLVDKFNITHIALSPAIVKLLLQIGTAKDFKIINDNLKYMMVAGEEFQFKLAKKSLEIFKYIKIVNLYGPTEATVYATNYEIDENIIDKNYIPIGVALDGAHIQIVDKNEKEVSTGEEGEIFIFGDGVALGYHNNLYLTNKKFGVDNNGLRFYRTGDIGKVDKDGQIKFLGRKDNQVQIHGIRVELGEIENAFLSLESIRGVCVVYEDEKLLAFIEINKNYSLKSIKYQLSNKLPKYMIPNKIIEVSNLPLNTNRKIDKKKLLKMLYKNETKSSNIENFKGNSLIISKLFNTVLGTEIKSSDDDFFEVGGDSLSSIYLTSLLEEAFNIELIDGFIYTYPTINLICKYIDIINNSQKEKKLQNKQFENFTIDKDSLKKELKLCYEKNSENMRNLTIQKEYEVFCYQKVYRDIKFDSKINIEIFINSDISIDEVEHTIRTIIKHNSLFRSFVIEKNDNLIFSEVINSDKFILAKYNLKNYEVKDHKKFKDLIDKELNDSIKIYNNEYLLYNMVLIEYKNGYILSLSLDHNISDLSCSHVLKQQFNDILSNKKINSEIDYQQFIKITEKNNNKNLLTQKYTQKIIETNKFINKQKLDELGDEILILRKSIDTINSNEWYINKSAYIVGQLSCEVFNSSSICINTILNLRKIKGMNLSNLIGDIHSIGTIIVNKEDSINKYEKYQKDEFDKFYVHEGQNPMHVIYKNLPSKSEYQKQLEKIYVTDIPVNLNYIGQIKQNKVQDAYNDLIEIKKELSKFKDNMLRTTVVSTDKYLYIFMLKKPIINHKILDKLDIEIFEFNSSK